VYETIKFEFVVWIVLYYPDAGAGTSFSKARLLSKEISRYGTTVVKFKYANQHDQLQFDITNKDGKREHWSTIMHSVNTLRRNGIVVDIMRTDDKAKEIQLADKRMAYGAFFGAGRIWVSM